MTQASASDITLSRRRVVAYAAAALAYAPVMTWGTAPAANPGGGVEETTLATRTKADQRLTVAVRINAFGPYQFIVDTGAERSVISEELASLLNLARGDNVRLEGAIRQLTTSTVAVHTLSMGAVSRGDLVLPTLPRVLLEADGYLGLDVLDDCRVLFDFKRHTLWVGSPQSKLRSYLTWSNAVRIKSSGRLGHLRVIRCLVDDVPATGFLDTGAEISAGNLTLFKALVDRHPDYVELGELPLTDVTGGTITGRVVDTELIRVNALSFSAGTLVIADLPVFDLWGLSKVPALLLGMNYLRQFARVTVDYPLNEIQFELTQEYGEGRTVADAWHSSRKPQA